MNHVERRLILAAMATAGALTGAVSVQHIALTAVAAAALDRSLASCPAVSEVLTPALVGSVAGGLVAVIGAVGSVVIALRGRSPVAGGPSPK